MPRRPVPVGSGRQVEDEPATRSTFLPRHTGAAVPRAGRGGPAESTQDVRRTSSGPAPLSSGRTLQRGTAVPSKEEDSTVPHPEHAALAGAQVPSPPSTQRETGPPKAAQVEPVSGLLGNSTSPRSPQPTSLLKPLLPQVHATPESGGAELTAATRCAQQPGAAPQSTPRNRAPACGV